MATLAVVTAELARRESPESGAVCKELAETLGKVQDQAEYVMAGLVGRVDATGEQARWGFASIKAWLCGELGMQPARAAERLSLARQRRRLPETTQRWADGTLPLGQVATITRAVAKLNDEDVAKAEEALLEYVDQGWSARLVGRLGQRIREVIADRDDTGEPKEAARGYDKSWIAVSPSLDGGRYLKGWLNPEDAAVWDGTLAPLAKPAGPEDTRDVTERTAAALSTMLAGGHRATKVTVICDLDTLTGGQAPARLADGTPIPAEHARRIALSAGVSPLLLGRGHTPLYLGRTARFATTAQRQVLETLYDTCAVHGCEIPGALCEVDHITGWALGNAPTDIDRLALCCGWHNRFKHTHPDQIHITRDNTGRYVYRLLPPPGHRPRTAPTHEATERDTSNHNPWLGSAPPVPTLTRTRHTRQARQQRTGPHRRTPPPPPPATNHPRRT
ncbi:HNH endonuclease signature motif containing protein [Actinomadura macrotermitis]|nr:HNH endonuclease signature motif containing protein [Actinomadura macrotermitis]